MPTFRPGRSAYLKLIHSGTTQIFSSGVETGELARLCASLDVSHWGQTDAVFIAGIRSATVKVTGPWASTYETFLAGCLGSSANPTFVFGPESTVTGRVKYTGALVLKNYAVSAPAKAMVATTLDFDATGAITSTKF